MKKKSRQPIYEYYGEIGSKAESDGDALFWKNVSTEQKFTAAWEIIKDYYLAKGKSHELRFLRSIETAGEF